MKHHLRWLALVLALALVAAACGGDDEEGSDTTSAPETTEATDSTDATDETPSTEGGDEPMEEGYVHLAAAEAGEYSGTTVEILTQWIDNEGTNFEATFADFQERTGITVVHDGITEYETVLTTRVEGGNAPDIAQLAQPGLVAAFAGDGHLVALDSFMDLDQLGSDYSEAWTSLGAVDGTTYGVFFKADTKSIVWYPVAAFEDAGYTVPTTWDELTALTDQIKADGGTPWCVSIEHGDASGWVATDWMEDILLRTAPLETYDAWITHDVPFNDPEVLEAAAIMNDLWFTDGNVFGGYEYINATWVGDTPTPMFTEGGPDCWLHKQASWISGFFPGNVDQAAEDFVIVPGVDAKFFYFPGIEEEFGSPVLGSGDQMVMFNDRPEVRAVMEFLASPEAAGPWAAAGGFISPNGAVDPSIYSDYASQELSTILGSATALRFDASDVMVAEVGGGTFWSGMVDWVAANGEGTEEIFQSIEDSWPQG